MGRSLAASVLAALVAAGGAFAQAPPATGPAPEAPAERGVTAASAELRAGREALARGELERGVALLAAVEERHPIVSDHAALLAARALLESRRWDDAAATLARFRAKASPTPLEPDLERVQGEAELGRADTAAAHAAFSRGLEAAREPERAAPLLLALARLEEAGGQTDQAAARWLLLWRDHPLQPAANGSGERLEALGRSLGRELRTASDARDRGDRLFEGGQREVALEAYALALALGLDGEAGAHVVRRRGEALFGLRRYGEAAAAFAALGDDAEAEVYRARAVARSGDVEGAVALLLAAAERRPGAAGAPARWYAALILDGEDETARAAALFDAVASTAAEPALRAGAHWRLGWASYRARRFAEARRRFEQMEGAAQEPVAKLQARYWAARAGKRSGQGEPARELARLSQDAPFSYYGWRARERLAERTAPTGHAAMQPPLPAGNVALGPRDLERPQILAGAGLSAAAVEEIDRLAPRAEGLADTLLLAASYLQAGAYDRAEALAVKRYGEALPSGPSAGQEGLWRAAWPRAFADDVRRSLGRSLRLDPALVYALMREESGFRPAVISAAGARGLMQLLPETAARMAAQIGLEGYEEQRLVEPAINIRLGVAYLASLLGRFGGRASAAIGSYNAGPEPVARWLGERPGQADNEWVEAIPFDETRNYVKRVLRSLHAYRELYAHEP